MKKYLPLLLVSAVALAGLAFVWPTAYIISAKDGEFKRVNRFTGVVEYASPNGWTNPYAPLLPDEKPHDIAKEVRVEVPARIESPVIESVLRNEPGRDLRLVRLEFSMLDRRGVVVDHGDASLESVRAGDAVKVCLSPNESNWPGCTARIDRVVENAPVGLNLAVLR